MKKTSRGSPGKTKKDRRRVMGRSLEDEEGRACFYLLGKL
jgi:hypothetical protein